MKMKKQADWEGTVVAGIVIRVVWKDAVGGVMGNFADRAVERNIR
ncbi:hypothetical protein [Cohnella mopanensis]|nr:hypothetical protein [Cohnella mopanensis]